MEPNYVSGILHKLFQPHKPHPGWYSALFYGSSKSSHERLNIFPGSHRRWGAEPDSHLSDLNVHTVVCCSPWANGWQRGLGWSGVPPTFSMSFSTYEAKTHIFLKKLQSHLVLMLLPRPYLHIFWCFHAIPFFIIEYLDRLSFAVIIFMHVAFLSFWILP